MRSAVESTLPGGVTLIGFELTPGAPAATKLSDDDAKKAVGLEGTVTLDSPNTLDIASIAERLRTVGAIMLSDANAMVESTTKDGHYTYTIDVSFDQRIYTGRFAAEGKK